jgi:hypothetical protein
MPSLSDIQSGIRSAVVESSFDHIAPWLTGGSDPTRRLAIHRRHYHASLIETVIGRYPATGWLLGGSALTAAASAFVATRPPRVFCMAEFGAEFPAFLASQDFLRELPYLRSFAELEWCVGAVSVAVSETPVGLDWLAAQSPDDLEGATLRLQPGLAWVEAGWSVDELLQAYLSVAAPDSFPLVEGPRWIEVRGARGDIAMHLLTADHWHFRRALSRGASIHDAASAALDIAPDFDAGAALVDVFASGLITS